MTKTNLSEGFDGGAITPEDSPMAPMDIVEDPRSQSLRTAQLKRLFFTKPLFDPSKLESATKAFPEIESQKLKPGKFKPERLTPEKLELIVEQQGSAHYSC